MAALDGTAPMPEDELEISYVQRPWVPATAVPASRPGRVVTQPADVTRFDATTFRFEGGDPVADLPTVVLQRQDADGQWVAAEVRGGRPLDRPFEYALTYRLSGDAHLWVVDFEPSKDWPAGLHRFVASGSTGLLDGDYEVASAPFAVRPADTLQVLDVTRDGDVVTARLAYTPVPTNRRLLDADLPADRPAPVRAGVVTFEGAAGVADDVVPEIVQVDANTIHAVYRVTLPGTDLPTVTGVDVWGNTTG